jgi:hypothetical protein
MMVSFGGARCGLAQHLRSSIACLMAKRKAACPWAAAYILVAASTCVTCRGWDAIDDGF